MRFKGFLLAVGCFLYAYYAAAQVKSEYTTSRILILLDRSSSMVQQWGGVKSKAKAADELILKLIDSVYRVNPDVEFSLRVFGHQYTVPENNCHDTKNEVPFAKDNRARMAYRLEDIAPLGVTSIAYSLEEAAKFDLVDAANYSYSVLLITDGGESCGGDICAVMNKMINNKIHVKPYIISLEDYAPLRSMYACMGDYLQVLNEGDILPAVGTIVNAFRPVLKIKTADFQDLQTIAANAPSVLKVNAPVTPPPAPAKPAPVSVYGITPTAMNKIPVKATTPKAPVAVALPGWEPLKVPDEVVIEDKPARPIPETVAKLNTVRLRKATIDPPVLINPAAVNVPEYKPLVIEEAPERPAPEKIGTIRAAGLKPFAVEQPKSVKPKSVTEPAPPKLVIDTPAATPMPKDKIAKIQPVRIHQFGIIWVVEERSFPERQVPPMPPLKIDIPPVTVTKTKEKPTIAKEPEGKTTDFTVERDDAKETTVQVFFTNGRGKFYTTTPQILLLDVKTNALIKRFYRTVDPAGNPDAQTGVPPGLYNLTFAETSGLVVRNVKVEEHKNNKIIVKVNNASLSFEYAGDKSRPVTEFAARVIERNKPEGGRIQDQRCTEKLEYEPGNYHVVINTFPQDVRNIDLDFNEKVIAIPQPGFVRFTADPALSNVTLYQRLGDKFLAFNTLDLKDATSQHKRIQPGEYQAHYHKGPGGPSASEKVVPFIIRSNQETEVELK